MNTPLQDSAMLVSLNIAAWSARKHDKKVSEEVESKHGAHDAGRFNKMLIKKEALEPINKVVSAARSYLYEKTLPWGENGERLLPSSLYLDFSSDMQNFRHEFEQRVYDFGKAYPSAVIDAQQRLGTMYDAEDYPPASEIHERFDFAVSVLPVPSANDFRVNLNTEHVDAIKRDITRQMEGRQREAVKDCYSRVRTVVTAIHGRLKDEKAVFRDSLIGNARDLLQILPALNLTGDADLSKIADEINDLLAPPDRLRADAGLRAATAKKADAILAKMKGLGL